MKQGWEIKKLGEVCEIVGGSTPKTSEPIYWDGEHYWVTPAELDGSKYISSTSRTITDDGVKSAHLQLLPSGIVLLSSRAPIGKVAITTVPMYCNQGFKNLVCSDKLYNEFAYWFLYHNTAYLNSLGTGATFKEISKRVVEQIPIPIPPRAEQERIVEVLDREFEKIDAMKANAEQNLQHAKDLFQAALRKELQPKEGWTISELRGVCTFYNGKPHENNIDKEGKYILVNSKFIASDMQIYKRTSAQLFPLYRNDIVMVMSDVPNGKALGKCQIICEDGVYSLNQRICAFRNSKIDVKLLYYLINRNPYLIAFDNGENQTNLRKNDIITMPIHYPIKPQDVASLIERLDSLRDSCILLEENYKKTIALCDDMKQTLLRKAFNGEL